MRLESNILRNFIFQKILKMKPEFLELPLYHNEEQKQFEITVNNKKVYIEYEVCAKNNFLLVHTEAAQELAGTGAAQALVEKVFQFIEKNHAVMVPECPYLLSFVKKHPEWKHLVDKESKQYQLL